MNTQEFKRIGRLLKELYAALKAELQEAGVDIYSDEYDVLFKRGQDLIREKVLEKMGFTIEEYKEAKALVEAAPSEPSEVLNQIKEGIDAVRNTHIPSKDEITGLAKGVIPAPQVTKKTVNKIVKETIIEKPTVIRETTVKNTIEKADTSEIEKRIAGLVERLDAMPNDFAEHFEENINVLGMPDFRKLAMGLQAQIDEVRADITSEEAGDVDSVFGRTGTVVAVSGDYTTDIVTEGTNQYFTSERAQDAVGNAVGNGLDYDDTSGAISVDETELTHNSLGSKQGGTTNEFYHLTSAQNTLVGALDADLATFSLPASTTISTFGASLVDDANAAAAIATLGLDADLATFSLPASTTISAFGATLIDDADAATARTTLGLVAGGAGDIWVEKAGDTMTGELFISLSGSGTNDIVDVAQFDRSTSGSPAIGFGIKTPYKLEDSTGTLRIALEFETSWSTITGGSEASTFIFRTMTGGVLRTALDYSGRPNFYRYVSGVGSPQSSGSFITQDLATTVTNGLGPKLLFIVNDSGTTSPKTITGATNATPIVITSTSHGYASNDKVTITGVLGNTAANGTWNITVTGANTFSLTGSVGSGTYTSGGTSTRIATFNLGGIGYSFDTVNDRSDIIFFNRANLADTFAITEPLKITGSGGNVLIGASAAGTSAAKVLAIGNGTEPSTSPADMVQLYSVDLSAGNATLGLRTETAVVTESVTSDRTLSVRINGTTYKICLKA